MANKDRVTFGSKIGVILATVGCAVGLGSIWRFPYMVGSNGGGAFLLVFMICTVLLGLPIMITEFFIGRHSRRNAAGAFKELAPGTQWSLIGYNGVLAAFLILGFYSVVSGWTLEYIWQAMTGSLSGKNYCRIYHRVRSLFLQRTQTDRLDNRIHRNHTFHHRLRG